jgi:hypothetical protein
MSLLYTMIFSFSYPAFSTQNKHILEHLNKYSMRSARARTQSTINSQSLLSSASFITVEVVWGGAYQGRTALGSTR